MLTRFINKIIPPSGSKETDGSLPSGSPHSQKSLPAVPDWKAGDTIMDRYLVNDIFEGAMGKVFIAQHLGWKIPVAIKVPKPEVLEDREGFKRTYNEAKNWVRMGMHPNIASCYYILKIENIPHLFIEFVDGGDLSSWLKMGRCKDPRTALSLAIQFCHGMEFTHSRGIIHRDIKPQNILITKNALLKITDFGIIQTIKKPAAPSKKFSAEDDPEKTIGFRGTPGYASPEQFRDTHSVDLRTDIFSFGICLWLIFCGRKPYRNNQVFEKITPTPIKGSSQPFPDILKHLLSKTVAFEPACRYNDFKELRQDLNRAYIELFKINCPYMDLDFTDLQAENLNNRAVSFFELGKITEGRRCLSLALEANDAQPEAIYNYILAKWQFGKTPTEHIFRQIEAARHRLTETAMLDALAKSVKCEILSRSWEDEEIKTPRKQFFPEYTLCTPKNSLDVFRSGQLHRSTQENVLDLLEKKKFKACFNILITGWENIGFRADKIFIDAYEKLLKVCDNKNQIKNITRLATIPGNAGSAGNIRYLPGINKILSISKDGKVIIRPLKLKKDIKVLDKYANITCSAVSQDGQYLALADKNGLISLISITSGKGIKSFKAKGEILTLAFSPDSHYITSGNNNGIIQCHEISSSQVSLFSAKENGPIKSLTYFKKGNDFVTGSEDGTIRFWSNIEKECVRIVQAHAMPVSNLSAAANGLFFISGASDRIIKTWDRQTGQCIKSIKAHDDIISSVMMMPDSNYFISGSEDDILKVWELHTETYKLALDGRGDGICSLSKGPEPHIFLSGTMDGSIIIWMVVYDLGFY